MQKILLDYIANRYKYNLYIEAEKTQIVKQNLENLIIGVLHYL